MEMKSYLHRPQLVSIFLFLFGDPLCQITKTTPTLETKCLGERRIYIGLGEEAVSLSAQLGEYGQ